MNSIVLGLIFTRNTSLKDWVDGGLFSREKLLYEHMILRGHAQKVYWFTYGSDDEALAERLKMEKRLYDNIIVKNAPLFLSHKSTHWLYTLIMPVIHYTSFSECSLIKANQVDGSWTAILASIVCRKPFIMRSGYLMSQFQDSRANKLRTRIAQKIEAFAGIFSSAWITTTNEAKNYLSEANVSSRKLYIVNNFLDLNSFRDFSVSRESRFVYVGRLNAHKNLFNLMNGIRECGLSLDIYGQGELKEEIIKYSLSYGKIRYCGSLTNDEVPKVLNRYRYFIITSISEGSPKALLEAMACGCVCVATDVPGINNLIKNGENGILIKGTDQMSIVKTLQTLPHSAEESFKDYNGALIKDYSLESCVDKEASIYLKVLESSN